MEKTKERPIIFNGTMVRALLDGSKTQTRRIVKHQWPHLWQEPWYPTGNVLVSLPKQPGAFMEFRHREQDREGYAGSPASILITCPYGPPGGRLWVRETWQGPLFASEKTFDYQKDPSQFERPEFCKYAADGGPAPEFFDADDNLQYRWRPSIHMPRWASRITLEVTEVRVERMNAISEADAQAEGIQLLNGRYTFNGGMHESRTAVESFRALWESLNGAGSWDANPWVWVVSFRRIDQ